jgi:disulfide bond formation protein DsbB
LSKLQNKLIFLSWIIALVASLGSLFFSEVMGYPPCSLCWYQRIAMYPLVILFGVGLFQPLKQTLNFSIPLVILGWIIAVYHNLLSFGIIPESASPCRSGVPCSTIYIELVGFITIPLLSFFAFTLILAILIYLNRSVTLEK